MKKILVPVDFSKPSLNALSVACQLAVRANAGIDLLHVNVMASHTMSDPYDDFPAAVAASEAYHKEATERIEVLKATILKEPAYSSLRVEAKVIGGSMIPIIKELVTEDGIDLIVMGTLGASGWKELFLGSNTERVIRHAPCAVLVIPEGIDTLAIKRVMVPSTLQEDQKGVFETVKSWDDLLGFKVEVLYINDPLYALAPGDVQSEKDRLVLGAGLTGVSLHQYGQVLHEEDAIQDFAKKAKADLIVMGTHQRRGLSHLLFGSIVEDTVNHSHVPVLSVPIK